MKCYRGFPRACHALETRCAKTEIKYDSNVCQSAFNRLLSGSKMKEVEKLFGKEIINCFNKHEITKYGD